MQILAQFQKLPNLNEFCFMKIAIYLVDCNENTEIKNEYEVKWGYFIKY